MSQRKKAKKKSPGINLPPSLQHVNLDAAGIDVGSNRHFVAGPECSDEVSVREFGPFTEDLTALAEGLGKWRVTTVASESTWVNWIQVSESLATGGRAGN